MPTPNSHHRDITRERLHGQRLFHEGKQFMNGNSSQGSLCQKVHPLSPTQLQPSQSQHLSIPRLPERLTDDRILAEYIALYESIITYVKIFYTTGPVYGGGASQMMIEQASTGILLPWPQILDLLGNAKTRPGVLAMCIAGTMLSRSLLLKLGISNSPGATFLPPEIVDCFQSFCIGKSAATLDGKEPMPIDFALLSRWKQISATLLHSTYVADAFSPFDGRTLNIERALKDLDPLLASYAVSHDAGREKGARTGELRILLRKGAKLAFMLFSQPCLWKFDWYSDRETEAGEDQFQQIKAERVNRSTTSFDMMRSTLTPTEIVVWPRLLRVVDQDGCRLEGDGDGIVLGKKKYLDQLL